MSRNPVDQIRPFDQQTGVGNGDDYATKVVKLVPVETVAFFVPAISLAHGSGEYSDYIEWIVFFLGLIGTFVYLSRAADKNKPWVTSVLISTVGFIVWAYAVRGDMLVPELYNPSLSSLLLLTFTYISGLIPLRK